MLRDEVAREVRAWVEKAESDLKAVDLLIPAGDAPFDVICFHAQQAAEKYLKATLTCLGVPFPKTHDLAVLVGLFPRESALPGELADLSELTDAAISVRYPGFFEEYDRETAEALVTQALHVKSAALQELSRLGCPMKGDVA
jgi:HEPN domain-containing protein